MVPSTTTSSSTAGKANTTIKFTRVFNNFSKLDFRWHYSTAFVVAGCEWRLLVHPGKNAEKGEDFLWVCLRLTDSEKLPSGWSINIDFSSTLINQIHNKDSIKKCEKLKLNEGRIGHGYLHFMYCGIEGYVVNDNLIIETHLSVEDTSSSRDSNKQIEDKMIPLLLTTPDIPSVICSSSTTTFTWVINKFTSLKINSLYSTVFIAGDNQWKLLVYPGGNDSKYLSVYLFLKNPTRLVPIIVEFSLKVVNQILKNDSIWNRCEREFGVGQTRWGWQHFMCLTKLKDPSKGYLVKDTVTIEVNMSVFHSSSHSASLAPSSSSALDRDLEKEMDAKMIPLIPVAGDTNTATFLVKSKNLSEKLSNFEMAQKWTSASSSTVSGSALQQQRKAFKQYLVLSSLEAIDQANAFDEIARLALLLVQHSESSLERAILRDLSSRLVNLKDVVPATKASFQNVRAQKETLSGKKVAVQSRLNKGKEQLSTLEVEFSKLLEEESELEAEFLRLTIQREELLITKNSMAIELKKINEQVAKDLEESNEIRKKDELAAINLIQTTEKLARANLSWQLFKQNLELCVTY